MNYVLHVLVLMTLYWLLAASLNLVVGYAGLLSLSHAAFYGIGAYTTGLLITRAGWDFLLAMAGAAVLTPALAAGVALPMSRLKGDYFVLGTLSFQMIVFAVLYNWTEVTRGPYGLSGLPVPQVFGASLGSVSSYCIFSAVVSGACLAALWAVAESPFGRALKAVRENEVAAAALGKNVPTLKVTAFALGAAPAAVAGALFTGYTRYIDPTSFTLDESVFVLAIVIIGGAGRFAGPLLGAAILVVVPELLRYVKIPDPVAAPLRQVLYGALLILLMRYRPQGLWGDYNFDRGAS